MALIKCPECKKEISTTAEACPHCGALINEEIIQLQKKKKNREGNIQGLIVLVVAVLVIYWLISSDEDTKKEDTPQTARAIKKNYGFVFAFNVPDAELAKETKPDFNTMKDSADITCNDYEKGSESRKECVYGRQKIFDYRLKHSIIWNFCTSHHHGTDYVALCMISWIEHKHWISGARLSTAKNLKLRGCIKQHGTAATKVMACAK